MPGTPRTPAAALWPDGQNEAELATTLASVGFKCDPTADGYNITRASGDVGSVVIEGGSAVIRMAIWHGSPAKGHAFRVGLKVAPIGLLNMLLGSYGSRVKKP